MCWNANMEGFWIFEDYEYVRFLHMQALRQVLHMPEYGWTESADAAKTWKTGKQPIFWKCTGKTRIQYVPKSIFLWFSKNVFLDIFFKFWNSDLNLSDKLSFCLKNKWQNLRSSWGSDIPLALILYPCSWKSSWALFNRFYGFILFLNSWIFQIPFEEHLRMKYSFRILGLSLAFLLDLILIYS